MTEKRVNPKTGVIEERSGGLFGGWSPAKNESGNTERVNPKTGVTEERWKAGGGLVSGWGPKSNERGNQERVNKDTGVREERWSEGGGLVTGWGAKRDDQGNRERVNKDTGLKEKSWREGGGIASGWEAKVNENGNRERVRSDGRTEERHDILGGLVKVWEIKRQGRAAGGGGGIGGTATPDFADTHPSEEQAESHSSAGSYTSSRSRFRFPWPDVGFAPWLFGYQVLAILILDNPLPRFLAIFGSDSWLIFKVIEALFMLAVGAFIYVFALILHPLLILAMAGSDSKTAVQVLLIFGPTYPVLIWHRLSRR